MAIYSGSLSFVGTAALGAPLFEIKAGAVSARLLELSLNAVGTNNCVLMLSRPTNDGATVQSAPATPLAEDPSAPAATARLAVTWTGAPLWPGLSATMRRWIAAGTFTGTLWTFPRGLILPPTRSVAVFCHEVPCGTVNFYAVLDE
jgi:hypothetical protein